MFVLKSNYGICHIGRGFIPYTRHSGVSRQWIPFNEQQILIPFLGQATIVLGVPWRDLESRMLARIMENNERPFY